MRKILCSTALSIFTVASNFTVGPTQAQAQAYQIDCAILLCLAGGFPPSVPCAAARVEVIRRITPWPIEPPLQLWRCPLGVSAEFDPSMTNTTDFYNVMLPIDDHPRQTTPHTVTPINVAYRPTPLPHVGEISGIIEAQTLPEYVVPDFYRDEQWQFLRTINVYDIQIDDDRRDDRCERTQNIRKGTYDNNGDFQWTSGISRYDVPSTFGSVIRGCSTDIRAIYMTYTDFFDVFADERIDY